MAAKHSRHIALTGPLAGWVAGQVGKGAYTSTSDLIRTAVRLLQDRDEGSTGPASNEPRQGEPRV